MHQSLLYTSISPLGFLFFFSLFWSRTTIYLDSNGGKKLDWTMLIILTTRGYNSNERQG